jgi:hypothetical protein
MSSFPEIDLGGSVVPNQLCPHVFSSYDKDNIMQNLDELMKQPCFSCHSSEENWLCLSCGVSLCSRYVAAHMEEHWMNTSIALLDENSNKRNSQQESSYEVSFEEESEHCLALSYADLSVWCYVCNSYVKHERLIPLLVKAESVKFNQPERLELLRGCENCFHTAIDFCHVDKDVNCSVVSIREKFDQTFLTSKLQASKRSKAGNDEYTFEDSVLGFVHLLCKKRQEKNDDRVDIGIIIKDRNTNDTRKSNNEEETLDLYSESYLYDAPMNNPQNDSFYNLKEKTHDYILDDLYQTIRKSQETLHNKKVMMINFIDNETIDSHEIREKKSSTEKRDPDCTITISIEKMKDWLCFHYSSGDVNFSCSNSNENNSDSNNNSNSNKSNNGNSNDSNSNNNINNSSNCSSNKIESNNNNTNNKDCYNRNNNNTINNNSESIQTHWISIFNQIVLPLIEEYCPDLIFFNLHSSSSPSSLLSLPLNVMKEMLNSLLTVSFCSDPNSSPNPRSKSKLDRGEYQKNVLKNNRDDNRESKQEDGKRSCKMIITISHLFMSSLITEKAEAFVRAILDWNKKPKETINFSKWGGKVGAPSEDFKMNESKGQNVDKEKMNILLNSNEDRNKDEEEHNSSLNVHNEIFDASEGTAYMVNKIKENLSKDWNCFSQD